MIYAVLILLGLSFGSFVNAMVWRIHQQALPKSKRKAGVKDLSVSKGRSMCVHCGHTLKSVDLIPVLSWLSLKGKCRYCKKAISWQYPLVELATALLFIGSYIFWPGQVNGLEVAVFGLWLVLLTGLVALVVYDIRWMILPNRIIFPLYGVAGLAVLLKAAQESSIEPIIGAIVGVLIGGGIFMAMFYLSSGKWIGGGDVKLGFLLGAIVGGPANAVLLIFLASLLGTLLILPLMALKKITPRTRIPFGPFLIAAAVMVQLFGQQIIDAYMNFVGL